ncbi:type 2 isopentenyl-diphosphate Delta-isomerase [Paenibacillus contaminans]|uniref:Isopentenyl-diphosphate delta-isomerase n=1 Tax=Paenibacillus contaminans TaxID=450362 RepID=A0A329MR43_9BACL|nr:type 2 isopentenyl-diphosphate Delta-isomerase [Paenibacillus contaminans]RAV21786.1 type 2 isopentenyl-diphosphate Delta-isomerase [Paenibacillus contaminans]
MKAYEHVNGQASATEGSGTIADSAAVTESRKAEHIEICLNRDVGGERIRTGFERYRFRHNALPERRLADISLSTVFLNKTLRAPLLVSSMTGGTKEAAVINMRLAAAAERRGWAMGLGSMRAAIEKEELADTFRIRKVASTIPVIANLGAVQLNYGYGADQCRHAVELAEADALVLHLNSLQEAFQPEGDTDFSGLLNRIEQVCKSLHVPVGIKEVGWGIDGESARKLAEAGISFIDVAGAGGTSWSQVEKHRSRDAVRKAAAEAFADWGIPTAECIRDVRTAVPDAVVIGSGGVQSGVDAAKAIALGADLAGFGRSLLAAAVDSEELIEALFGKLELELRIAMFGIGAGTIRELKETNRLEMSGL